MWCRSWLFKKLRRLVEEAPPHNENDGASIRTSGVPRKGRRSYQLFKRCFDITGSSILFITAFPAFVIIGFLIRRDSPGPVLFVQQRVGKGGKLFRLYKFRTMVVKAAEVLEQSPELQQQYQDTFKIKNDPRITPFGEFLRRTSLDELPQLFNVIRGEMSLVGPRPLLGP
ncbi:MAG: sugar transferase, partial [Armatimonadota bacterium]|nr:sugar transferase [Armatimonadota bacterium]